MGRERYLLVCGEVSGWCGERFPGFDSVEDPKLEFEVKLDDEGVLWVMQKGSSVERNPEALWVRVDMRHLIWR